MFSREMLTDGHANIIVGLVTSNLSINGCFSPQGFSQFLFSWYRWNKGAIFTISFIKVAKYLILYWKTLIDTTLWSLLQNQGDNADVKYSVQWPLLKFHRPIENTATILCWYRLLHILLVLIIIENHFSTLQEVLSCDNVCQFNFKMLTNCEACWS